MHQVSSLCHSCCSSCPPLTVLFIPPPSPSSGGPQLMASGWLGTSVSWTPSVLTSPPTLSSGHIHGQTHRVSILPAFGTHPFGLNSFLVSPLVFVSIGTVLMLTWSAHMLASLESDLAAFECLASCTFLFLVCFTLSPGFIPISRIKLIRLIFSMQLDMNLIESNIKRETRIW